MSFLMLAPERHFSPLTIIAIARHERCDVFATINREKGPASRWPRHSTLHSSSGSLAIFAAIRRASSRGIPVAKLAD